MFKRLIPLLAALVVGAALAQTTISIPVPAVTPAPITFTGSDGESFTVSPKPVTPPPVKYTSSAPPPVVVSTTAVIGSLAPAGSPTSITDASGAVWAVSAGVVQKGGAPVGVSSGVILLVMDAKGALWQENASCLWWTWSGTTWGTGAGSATGPAGVTLPTCTPSTSSTTAPPQVVTPPPVTTPPVSAAMTPVFSYPNGFSAAVASGAFVSSSNAAGGAAYGGDLIPAYTTDGHAAGGWFPAQPSDISGGFQADFGFNIQQMTGSVTQPSITGMAFAIQASTAAGISTLCTGGAVQFGRNLFGPTASSDANMVGMGGYPIPGQCPVMQSVFIKIDAAPANGQWTTQAFPSVPKAIAGTGLFLNAGPLSGLMPGLDMAGSGINLYSGHPFHAWVDYDTRTLYFVLQDTVTQAQFATSWPVSIPAVIGNTKAWLGMTAGVGPGVKSQFHITSYNLSIGMPTPPPMPPVPVMTAIASISPSTVVTNGSASQAGGVITLSDNQNAQMVNEAGSAWSAGPLPVATFRTSFTMQYQKGQGGGMAFVLQNIPTTAPSGNYQWISGGPHAVGNADGYGFGGWTAGPSSQMSWLQNSVAVKFDGNANTTGMYLSGSDPSQNSVAIAGLTIGAGNLLACTLSYDGSSLVLNMTDTVTKAAFTHTWAVNVVAAVGGSSAYAGFTSGAYAANQYVTAWTFGQ